MKYLLLAICLSAQSLVYSQSYQAGIETGLSNWYYSPDNRFEKNNYTNWNNGLYIQKEIRGNMLIKASLSYADLSPTYTGPIFPELGQHYYNLKSYQINLLVDHRLLAIKKLIINAGIGMEAMALDQVDTYVEGIWGTIIYKHDKEKYTVGYISANTIISYKISKRFSVNTSFQYAVLLGEISTTHNIRTAPEHIFDTKLGIGYLF
jgi:hypothetical protein